MSACITLREAMDDRNKRGRTRRAVAALSAATLICAIAVGLAYTSRSENDVPVATSRPRFTPTQNSSTAQYQVPNPCPLPTATPLPAAPELIYTPMPDLRTPRKWNIETSCGPIEIDLDVDKAPVASANFAHLARAGFWNQTLCHRLVISEIFVLQCGDPTGTGTGGPGYSFGPVENAPADEVYPAGTLAMARVRNEEDSQGSQFFIVYQDSKIPADAAGGFTVLGTVTSGLKIVTDIADGGTIAGYQGPRRPLAIERVSAP